MSSRISNDKPLFENYASWLSTKGNDDIRKYGAHYDAATALAKSIIIQSDIWKNIVDEISEANDSYRIAHKTQLIVPKEPDILIKSYSSFLNKNYRKNVVNNKNWPECPDGGWVFPPDWLSSLNDVLRTTLVVSYVDGIQFLSDRISNRARASGGVISFDLNASMVGYYAGHIIVKFTLPLPNIEFDLVETEINVEIQITTHVKEAVKTILHPIYERARLSPPTDKPWQWDFSCDEFMANNLGHIIHYVEGMIVRVREQNEKAA